MVLVLLEINEKVGDRMVIDWQLPYTDRTAYEDAKEKRD